MGYLFMTKLNLVIVGGRHRSTPLNVCQKEAHSTLCLHINHEPVFDVILLNPVPGALDIARLDQLNI